MNALIAAAVISPRSLVSRSPRHWFALAACRLFEYYADPYLFKQALEVSRKPLPAASRDEIAVAIRAAWESGTITQRQVELDLGIHQSQFSKLVNGLFKEPKGHAIRLFEYSIRRRKVAPKRPNDDVDVDALRAKLTRRLMHAWDGTQEGAKALETILEGATRLRASHGRST